MDTVTSEQRSKNMSAIRSKDTKPEIYFRKLLFSRGYRYRVNSKQVSGHPDIYLKKYNTAIFIHGCFWHRHEKCKYAYMPKSNVEFWNKKFDTNIRRDARVVVNAITLETMKEVLEYLERREVADEEIVQLSVAKARCAGGYHMMNGQNPVYIVSFTFAGRKE